MQRVLRDRAAGPLIASACLWAGLAGCIYPLPSGPLPDTGEEDAPGSQTAAQVRTGSVSDGNLARVADVVVVAPVDELDHRFFVQDLGGGEYAGLQVHVAPGVSVPEVQPGDLVTVFGNAIRTGPRFDLWVRSNGGVAVTGSADITVTALSELPRDWAPWVGQPVALAGVDVTGCVVGHTLASTALPISRRWHDAGLSRGDRLDALTGVVVPVGFEAELWPRSASDVAVGSASNGCTLTIEDAVAEGVVGEVRLPGVVRTTPQAPTGTVWVQDPGGAAGLAVADALALPQQPAPLLQGVSIGQGVDLEGALVLTGGRLILEPTAATPGGVVGAVDVPVEELTASVGQLVRVSDVTVGSETSYGAWSTDAGFVVDATFVRPLPLASGQLLPAVVGVVDQWPDGTLALLPRSPSDLDPGP